MTRLVPTKAANNGISNTCLDISYSGKPLYNSSPSNFHLPSSTHQAVSRAHRFELLVYRTYAVTVPPFPEHACMEPSFEVVSVALFPVRRCAISQPGCQLHQHVSLRRLIESYRCLLIPVANLVGCDCRLARRSNTAEEEGDDLEARHCFSGWIYKNGTCKC